jgi:hypothetical protein
MGGQGSRLAGAGVAGEPPAGPALLPQERRGCDRRRFFPLATPALPATLPVTMTPKQAAARLLLATVKDGALHPTKRTREDMSAVLDSRISDEKREKILGFVAKIEAPYVERLVKLTGDGGDEGGEAAPAT